MPSQPSHNRVPFSCGSLFSRWPEALQPQEVYLRDDTVELVIGSPEAQHALVGVHIPRHPRDIPSVRVIDSNLDDATRAMLTQRLGALIAVWRRDELAGLRTCVDLLTKALQDPDTRPAPTPVRAALKALSAGDLSAALELQDLSRVLLESTLAPSTRCEAAVLFIALGRGRDAKTLIEQVDGPLPARAHRALSRVARHLKLDELALEHGCDAAPTSAEDLVELAEMAMLAGEPEFALGMARSQSRNARGPAAIRARWVDVLLQAGDVQGAIELARGLEEHEAALRCAELELARGCHEPAMQYLQGYPADGPGADRRDLLSGAASVLAGDMGTALEVLLPIEGREAEASFWIAEAQIRSGNHTAALSTLQTHKDAMGEHAVQRLLYGCVALMNGWRKTDYKHRSLLRLIGGKGQDFASLSAGDEQTLILAALTRLGGNRGTRLTILGANGSVRSAPELISPRLRAIQVQHTALHCQPAAVEAVFHGLNETDPDIPYWRTYGAELDLWFGHYEKARERFQASWNAREETRWMYVGYGAALTMLGQDTEALDVFERGVDALGPMSRGEATWAYRGEIFLGRGQLDRAQEEFEEAVRLRPSRISAHLHLARVHLAQGDIQRAERALAAAPRCTEILLWEAQRTLSGPADPTKDPMDELLRSAITLLHGNRSSYLLTFRGGDGDWRLMPIERHLPTCERLASFVHDQTEALVLGEYVSSVFAGQRDAG